MAFIRVNLIRRSVSCSVYSRFSFASNYTYNSLLPRLQKAESHTLENINAILLHRIILIVILQLLLLLLLLSTMLWRSTSELPLIAVVFVILLILNRLHLPCFFFRHMTYLLLHSSQINCPSWKQNP